MCWWEKQKNKNDKQQVKQQTKNPFAIYQNIKLSEHDV